MNEMSPEMIESAVERLRAIADPTRIRILMRLRAAEANVSQLSDEIGVAQPSMSKHLAQLRQAGLVKVRPEGAQALYSIRDDSVFGICDIVCSAVRQQHEERARALGFAKSSASRRSNRS